MPGLRAQGAFEGASATSPRRTDRPSLPRSLRGPRFGGGVTLRALASFHAYEDRTAGVLRGLSCPVMAIEGNADLNIGPAEIERIRTILAGRDAEVHRVHSVSHALTDALDPPDPPVIAPVVIERLTTFLGSVR